MRFTQAVVDVAVESTQVPSHAVGGIEYREYSADTYDKALAAARKALGNGERLIHIRVLER